MLQVKSSLTKSGITIKTLNKKYFVRYNNRYWREYPQKMKEFFLDNITFISTFHLPLFFDDNKITFNTADPLVKPWVYEVMMKYIPYSADVDNTSASQLFLKFANMEFDFDNLNMKLPESNFDPDEKALINFTFGKESLVTLGICDEIGLNNDLIYFESPTTSPIETKLKRKYSALFSKKLNKNIIEVTGNTYDLCDATNFGRPQTEWGYGIELTEYAIQCLPIIDAEKMRFIIFGNEKSCDNSYISREGYKSNPVYEQSSEWTNEISNMMKIITGGRTSVFSLVEPINELAVIKILHNRYSELGRFQFSCFPDNHPSSLDTTWCHMCTKCARIYVFMKAIGVDVKTIGFRENLFEKKYNTIFPIFNGTTRHGIPYDDSGLNRDELIFAFYLAYKNGETGSAIDLFKKRYLDEAKQREDELHKEFFGIFDSKTIPHDIRDKVVSIFKEELNGSI